MPPRRRPRCVDVADWRTLVGALAPRSLSPGRAGRIRHTWVIANDLNLTETGSVTDVTGGLGDVERNDVHRRRHAERKCSRVTVVARRDHPDAAGRLHPEPLTLDISSRWSDRDMGTDTATTSIAALNCAGTTVQTLAGHIYLCQNDNPTTTEVLGGTVGATGPQTVPTQGNPLNPDDVDAGNYTMTATPPPGFKMVSVQRRGFHADGRRKSRHRNGPPSERRREFRHRIRSRAGRRLGGRDLLRGGGGPGHDDHHDDVHRHPLTTGDPARPDDTPLRSRPRSRPALRRRRPHPRARPRLAGLHRCAGGQGVDLRPGCADPRQRPDPGFTHSHASAPARRFEASSQGRR